MPRFDPEQALINIEKFKVTLIQWVPTMFVRLLKLPDAIREKYDVSSLKIAIHAAAPCPIEVKQRMIAWWGPILQEYYAATEAAGVTLINSQEWLERPGSVGKGVLGTVRICDESVPARPELPVGETGPVYFERDVMPLSYHNDPETTREAPPPVHDNWATTGDMRPLHEDGSLHLTPPTHSLIILR